ncbi:hypothetical protein FisN_6Lh015 [Fistulifera solaris]|uniref:PDZ domain-containing protein n=1 Tax=Fistulifera solaris TaxID=1519565 RepID=A0A1Z5KPG4_FISSO|nr:hypothetical protein FisN_6Lh015 [Fistulifera solaris]|eukprot:GAX28159.1 hypothetical protein FisN_6Lh015 [Fistulifera solaris]
MGDKQDARLNDADAQQDEKDNDEPNNSSILLAHQQIDNLQDTSIRKPLAVDFAVTVHDDELGEAATPPKQNISSGSNGITPPSNNLDTLSPQTPRTIRKRKRKNGRIAARLVEIEEQSTQVLGLSMPPSQYQVSLKRRAVRKRESKPEAENKSVGIVDTTKGENEEEFGDVSLGMKLSVIAGKVIVQSLNALNDGRASPAQLAGLIRRGDVLLAVNGISLIHLPIDQLMKALAPLSTPDATTGLYPRTLQLRFDSVGGVDLLLQSERQQRDKAVANDVMALFPLVVDQLSGMPLDSPPPLVLQEASANQNESITTTAPATQLPLRTERDVENEPPSSVLSTNERISRALAERRQAEREHAVSEFFAWDDKYGKILRGDGLLSTTREIVTSIMSDASSLTKEQYLERGRRAILGATALTNYLERIDSGKDIRSFKSWKTTLSLRSNASSRRNRALDTFSLCLSVNQDRYHSHDNNTSQKAEENRNDIITVTSKNSDEGEEEIDGDELLLRLAANDEIWRKQVIEFLQNASSNLAMESESEDGDDSATSEDPFESHVFSNFLFGEKISKIIHKRKKSRALPPGDVTAVLFDLATKLNTSSHAAEAVPTVIHAGSPSASISTSKFPHGQASSLDGKVVSATQFLLEEALPAWCETFRPLPWDQRRILWPGYRQNYSGSTAASSTISDDLTVESMGTNNLASVSSKPRAIKNLREQVEEQVLDVETREETCYLLTYYFITVILAQVEKNSEESEVHEKATTFVHRFGAYLKLHACLVAANSRRAENVIKVLLELAQHDPRHKDVSKHIARMGSLILYEESMLSAFVERLHTIQGEKLDGSSRKIVDLCASAYPDLQPWQVKKQCIVADGSKFQRPLLDLFYTYLTDLLHPIDGQDAAKRDNYLVNEWCQLSIQFLQEMDDETNEAKEYKMHFMAVASRTSSTHVMYKRDLIVLLDFAMEINETDLALDLVDEIMAHPEFSNNPQTVNKVRAHMHYIEAKSLDVGNSKSSARFLRRIFKLLSMAPRSPSKVIRANLRPADEFVHLIQTKCGGREVTSDDFDLLTFLSLEAGPQDVLTALGRLELGGVGNVQPILRTLLQRAAHASESSELSVSLMKIHHARMGMKEINASGSIVDNTLHDSPTASIWQTLSTGSATIAK